MYAQILIATDGSELAGHALDQGLKLAKALGSRVTIVTVTEPAAVVGGGYATMAGIGFDPIPELIDAQKKIADGVLDAAAKTAEGQGVVDVKTLLVDNSFPAEGVVAAAEQIGADLIVMASHGRRGLGRLLLGSQTSNVLAHSKVPVLVTR
jgi:nucleotide-binding universal stress UspA family protein